MQIDISAENGVREHVEMLNAVDESLQRELLDDSRTRVQGAWIPALVARAEDEQDSKMIVAGASALVSTAGFTVLAAQSSVPLSEGLVPSAKWYASEFGARTRRATIMSTSRRGKRYPVTKMLNRGLHSRQKFGRIAFDAASEVATDMVRGWIEVTVDLYRAAVGDESRD